MSQLNFERLLRSLRSHPLLNPEISKNQYGPINLSVDNPELLDVDVSSSAQLEQHICNYKNRKEIKVAFGGYLERRGIYNRSAYFNQSDPNIERNIHLGLDLWIEADSPIYAPVDGVVHSFRNNTNHGDYGPTIILKHQLKGILFYTLYGHLSLESLKNKKEGQHVAKGELIGTLGTAEVNGDYPPHLHFQIIKDIQHYYGDYPGVSSRLSLEEYRDNCPDPDMLLNLSA